MKNHPALNNHGTFFLAFDVHVQINPPPYEHRLKAIFLLPGNVYTKGVT